VCGPDAVADAHVQAWLVGPGIADGDDDQLRRARDAVETGLPVAADAGALPALPDVLPPHVVLTPHGGELARLLQRYGIDLGRQGVDGAALDAVRQASDLTVATVLLKGATTLVAPPSGPVFSQSEATPWMATAGSGDVLAGILGSLLAQHSDDEDKFDACGISAEQRWAAIGAMAASLHGRAGTLASAGGPATAGAIASHLPEVMRTL
jgi:NAD(P)H-hydrate repair Nnr-like enzyme with NAD(P)H-hydrate dehydratase domain